MRRSLPRLAVFVTAGWLLLPKAAPVAPADPAPPASLPVPLAQQAARNTHVDTCPEKEPGATQRRGRDGRRARALVPSHWCIVVPGPREAR
ncbi:MAG: hypothetical protein U0869_14235 [Chloroflexota bacterium]